MISEQWMTKLRIKEAKRMIKAHPEMLLKK